MKKGQIVYKNNGTPKEIEKVGNKYIYLKSDNRRRYFKDTLLEDTTIGAPDSIYLSKEEYDNKVEHSKLCRFIRRNDNWGRLELDQLRKIVDIIKEWSDDKIG